VAPSSGSSSSFAVRERRALCDDALSVGPGAPTLCGEWTVLDLVVHLLVRERRPLAAGGIMVSALRGLTERASATLRNEPFDRLVERLRTPPAVLRPEGIQSAMNTVELFVHHEDVRRAQHAWSPRSLDAADEAALWRRLALPGRGLVRQVGVPVALVSGAQRVVLRRGEDPVVVSGPVGELALFLFGRAQVRGLSFDGPTDRVERLRSARLGF
jgi:uncharacterized protein (TIGR03085 family)